MLLERLDVCLQVADKVGSTRWIISPLNPIFCNLRRDTLAFRTVVTTQRLAEAAPGNESGKSGKERGGSVVGHYRQMDSLDNYTKRLMAAWNRQVWSLIPTTSSERPMRPLEVENCVHE